MKKIILTISIFSILFGAGAVIGHVNSYLLPEGCGSCHVGHGIENQPMLAAAEEDFCYQCHGSSENRSFMISSGKLSPAANLQNIEREFKKSFRHPVEEGSGHSPTEILPSVSGSAVNHAECVDCHNPHQKIQMGAIQSYDVPGYSLTGQYLDKSMHEYEICLKCHSGFVGFDRSAKDLTGEFAFSARSQHPVTKASIGKNLPSLSLTEDNLMKCSDCHTNDNPDGPRGPHGSNHRYLLSGNYTQDVYSEESPYAYEFCYSCHDRSSVLSNESFPLHRQHIEGDPISGRSGTSCFTCHASHGSPANDHLIEFNLKAITADNIIGMVGYRSTGMGTGECYLTCHGYAHNPGRY